MFQLARDGRLLREVTLQGAEAVDWEDIAIRGRTLYVGDIGDNAAQRPDIAVYRFGAAGAPRAVRERKLALRYPDGAHDAEALLVDPRTGSLAIVTKDFGGVAGVYTGRSGTLRTGGDALARRRRRRSRPGTSPPTAARSSCAPTTARSCGRAARRVARRRAQAQRRATAGAEPARARARARRSR